MNNDNVEFVCMNIPQSIRNTIYDSIESYTYGLSRQDVNIYQKAVEDILVVMNAMLDSHDGKPIIHVEQLDEYEETLDLNDVLAMFSYYN